MFYVFAKVNVNVSCQAHLGSIQAQKFGIFYSKFAKLKARSKTCTSETSIPILQTTRHDPAIRTTNFVSYILL
jgi:hypothetical protein